VLAAGPQWARSCADCQTYVIGRNGEVSTCPRPDGRGGAVELPMLRKDFPGCEPPCEVCPKAAAFESAGPVDPAADFGPWFWAARDLFREGRAVGFGSPDPLMRRAFALFDAADRDARDAALADAVAAGVARAVSRR
jgi:hypothetical protein